ncbi:unnamed protein product [Brassicogethes aeneus]|uniref:Uncharacterized protein n=1 Tax=Brassicogethes aeneus TaxID=1431903 RepID=A0A9P0B823_BRAAE|nr:unnamed protein product [Brassicogethes aeneus]
MLNSFRAKTNCENEAKFIQDHIIASEKHISDLCNILAAYSRKVARLRDKHDEVAKVALNYSTNENINKSLAVGLENFADSFSNIADYGDARVQLIDNKVVAEFAKYEHICKHVKNEVKDIYSARDKEVTRKNQLDRIRERNPRNRQPIIQAETELVKASTVVSKSIHNLEEKVITFERQKNHDIKSIFLDFLSTEMGYHAKALEILTKAYNDINSIDEEADFEEFKQTLRMAENIQSTSRTSLFRSTNTFGSLGAIFSQNKKETKNNLPKKFSKSEETLDSIKHSVTDSDDEVSEENLTDTEDKSSPILVNRQYK